MAGDRPMSSGPSNADPLSPYLYELVWRLLQEPLTAAELAAVHNTPSPSWGKWTAQETANRLRSLVARGWVTREETGIYRATPRAREAVSW